LASLAYLQPLIGTPQYGKDDGLRLFGLQVSPSLFSPRLYPGPRHNGGFTEFARVLVTRAFGNAFRISSRTKRSDAPRSDGETCNRQSGEKVSGRKDVRYLFLRSVPIPPQPELTRPAA